MGNAVAKRGPAGRVLSPHAAEAPLVSIVATGLVVTLRLRIVPNVGWQLHRWKWSKGNGALHVEPLRVVDDDLKALDLVTVHGPARRDDLLHEADTISLPRRRPPLEVQPTAM